MCIAENRNRFWNNVLVVTDEFCITGGDHSVSAITETANSLEFCTSCLVSFSFWFKKDILYPILVTGAFCTVITEFEVYPNRPHSLRKCLVLFILYKKLLWYYLKIWSDCFLLYFCNTLTHLVARSRLCENVFEKRP